MPTDIINVAAYHCKICNDIYFCVLDKKNEKYKNKEKKRKKGRTPVNVKVLFVLSIGQKTYWRRRENPS